MKKTLYYIILVLASLLPIKDIYGQPLSLGDCQLRLQTDSAEILFDKGVSKMVIKDHYLYAGGAFTTVGKFSGSFIEISRQTGEAVNRREWPKVFGKDVSAISDGNGGHIIFGDIRSISNIPRYGIGQVDKDGKLTLFQAAVEGRIYAAVLESGILYIGGAFNKVNGVPRNRLAAIDMNTGLLTSWDPDVKNTGPLLCRIECMVYDNGLLYVGGAFSHIGTTGRKNIAAVNINASGANNWAPEAYFSTATNYGNVSRMLKVGDLLYICGGFDHAGGSAHNDVAAVNINSGVATSWDPKPNSVVLSLANKGDTLYLGGAFYEISGQPRYSFAAYSMSTGNLLPIAINTKQRVVDKVHTITPIGDTLYIGGEFDTTNNQFRQNFAVANRLSGSVLAVTSHTNGPVKTLLYDNNKLYAGGSFISVGRKVRRYLAAIDLDADTVTDWYPKVNDEVKGLHIIKDVLYITGSFTKLNDSIRPYSGALNMRNWTVTKWNPKTNLGVSTYGIKDIVQYNNTMYLAGHFTTIGGQPSNGLAKTDTFGNVQPWVGLSRPGVVNALAVWKDTLYVGGVFNDLCGQKRTGLGSINLKTETPTTFNAQQRKDSFVEVQKLLINLDTLYVAGKFNLIYQILPSKDTLFDQQYIIGGYKSDSNEVMIHWGIPWRVPWYLNASIYDRIDRFPGFDGPMNDMVITNDRKLFVGGDFGKIYSTPMSESVEVRRGLCYFSIPKTIDPGKYVVPLLASFDPKVRLGPINTLSFYGNKQYFGGNYGDDSAGTQNAMLFYAPYILLEASLSTDLNDICAGTSITAQVTSTVTYSAIYEWRINGVKINNPLSYHSYSPANKDSIACIVSVEPNGCVAEWSDTTNSIIYNVMPNVTPDITINGPLEEEAGKTVTLKAIVKDADTSYTIEWFNRGVSIGKTKTDSISYVKGTGKDSIYAVITPRTDTCYVTDTSSLIVVGEKDETGIRSANGGDVRVMIYPNPFDTYVKIKGVEHGDVLLLYDVTGRKVSTTIISTNDPEYLLSTSIMKSGMYVLKLTDKEGLTRKTMLLQKQ